MNKGKAILGAAAGLFFAYVMAAPYITVHQIQSAAKNNDGAALSKHIDFVSLRQSVKDQMNALWAKKMAEQGTMNNNQFAAIGAAFAGTFVDKLVDAYVTPAAITQLMSGEQPQSGAGGHEAGHSERSPLSDASMSYASLNEFVISVNDEGGKEWKFILHRQGFDWKVTDIMLPMR